VGAAGHDSREQLISLPDPVRAFFGKPKSTVWARRDSTGVTTRIRHGYSVIAPASMIRQIWFPKNCLLLPVSGGSVTTVPVSGINRAFGVAVDGAGNLFIADYYNKQVVEVPAGGGAQATLPLPLLQGPSGVAVDGAGNVFVSDVSNQVFEVPAAGCPVAGCSTIGTGFVVDVASINCCLVICFSLRCRHLAH
jgi:DNA-binding beta-propeller fold protein YncE